MPEKENPPCGAHEVLLEEHGKRLDKIDIILDKVRNRPPVWATFVFGVLLAVIGYLVRLANGG